MSFEELFINGEGPRTPLGWCPCVSVVADLVVLQDEMDTTQAWAAMSTAQRNDPLFPRPMRKNTLGKAHLLDIPREQAEADESMRALRDECVGKFEHAFFVLGRAAEAGLILSAVRPKVGGGLQPLDKGIWGIDDFWPRLSTCSIDLDNPFSDSHIGTHWIFFEQESRGWFIDSERLSMGLPPRYHRRFQPIDEQDLEAPFPGKDEAQALLRHWVAMRTGEDAANKLSNGGGSISRYNLPVPMVSSGMAGRPSSKHVVIEFFTERVDGGLVAPSLRAEAKDLRILFMEWRASNAANVFFPTMAQGTIENAIRDKYNAHQRGCDLTDIH